MGVDKTSVISIGTPIKIIDGYNTIHRCSISAITSGLMTIKGTTLPTNDGYIFQIYYGQSNKACQMNLFIPGVFSTTASSTLLQSVAKQLVTWELAPATLSYFRVSENQNCATTHPKVNLVLDGYKISTTNSGNGLTVTTANTWYSTTTDIDPAHVVVNTGSTIEVSTTLADTSGTLDMDLSLEAVFVFND